MSQNSFFITSQPVNFRREPRLRAGNKIRVLPSGVSVLVLSHAGASDNHEWFYCLYEGQRGYIASRYLYQPLVVSSPVGDRVYLDPNWFVTNPYLNTYNLRSASGASVKTTHTGIDLFRRDTHVVGEPVRAVADGQVICAADGGGSWMGLVVIRHDHSNTYTVSRSAHLDPRSLKVRRDDRVFMGQVLGFLGSTKGRAGFAPHLHLDFSRTGNPILLNSPTNWFGYNPSKVFANYQNPERLFHVAQQG